jgi:hypothetical protein
MDPVQHNLKLNLSNVTKPVREFGLVGYENKSEICWQIIYNIATERSGLSG